MYYAKIVRKKKTSPYDVVYIEATISNSPPNKDDDEEIIEILQDEDKEILHEKTTRYIEEKIKSSK